MSLVGATAKMVLRDDPALEDALIDLVTLLRGVSRTAKKRNAYIHDPWAMEPETPRTVSQLRRSGTEIHGEGRLVSGKDISQLMDQIDVWNAQLYEFYDRILPLLPASLGKLDRTRSLTLAFARTILPRGKEQASRRRQRGPSPASS